MRRITYGLSVLLIFAIPWEDSISVAALGSMARVIGMVIAVFWAGTMLIEGRFRKPHLFHVLVLLFFLWNFVSVSWSVNTEATIQRIKTYSQIFLLMLIFWEVFQKPENLVAGLQAYVYGAYVLIASTIYNYINGTEAVAYQGRYSTTGVNAVELALILVLGLPVAMHLFFAAEQSKKGIILKLIYLAYIPLAIFAILLTGSRTSLLAAIPFGIYFVGTQQIKFNRKLLVFGILLISLLALLPFTPLSVIARLGTLGASIEAADLGGRVALWGAAIIKLSGHPFIGLGSGTMRSVIGTAAHNTFVSVLAETGFIGFVLFFTILVFVLFQAMNIPNGKSGFWVTIFLTWVIGVSSLSWEFQKPTWLFLSFIVIEGNFTYEQLHIGQAKVKISKSIKRFLNANEPEIKTGTD
jgi:O-antigen ligase